MPRKASRRDEVLQAEDAASAYATPRRKSRPRKPVARGREIAPAPMARTNRLPQDPVHAFMRSGLLLAALRVWELKHGIHDYF